MEIEPLVCFTIAEFIVQFTGYYTETSRATYLLRIFERNRFSDFEILKRNNLMQRYPSDFDIVRVRCLWIGLRSLYAIVFAVVVQW